MGQLRGSADDRREVVSRVFAKLRKNDFRALRTFPAWRARNPDRQYDDWLAIVTVNVIRDHVARRLGATDESGAALKRLVNTLAESLDDCEPGSRPTITGTVVARQLLEDARTMLPDDQYNALTGWLTGADFGDLGQTHGWTPEVARAKVRAALARLRREVRGEG